MSRSYDTTGEEKHGEGFLTTVCPQLSPQTTKVGTRTCFFLTTQSEIVSAVSQSSLSCTPRTSLPPPKGFSKTHQRKMRDASQKFSVAVDAFTTKTVAQANSKAKARFVHFSSAWTKGTGCHRINSHKNLHQLQVMVYGNCTLDGEPDQPQHHSSPHRLLA